jgi:hypothetical protein
VCEAGVCMRGPSARYLAPEGLADRLSPGGQAGILGPHVC